MFFLKKYRELLKLVIENQKFMNNRIEQCIHQNNQIQEMILGISFNKHPDLDKKIQENANKVNSMMLELKGVISTARAALSERKDFDKFLELANKKILEMIELGEKTNSQKIDKELVDVKKMMKKLTTEYESIYSEPYAKVTCILSTLSRIEESVEKLSVPKKQIKLPKNFGSIK